MPDVKSTTRGSWIKQCQAANQAMPTRLFCFPFAGGSAQAFEPWGKFLGNTVELCTVQLPGRGELFRLPLHTAMTTLIEALYEQLLPWLEEKPFVFYGHSMGGLIAFELTKRLMKANLSPNKVIISACAAPSTIHQYGEVHQLPDEQLLARVIQMGGTPKEFFSNPSFLEYCLPILRADFSVFHRYAYEEDSKINVPITAIGGTADKFVPEACIEPWRYETTTEFNSHYITGDHFFIQHEEKQFLTQLLLAL